MLKLVEETSSSSSTEDETSAIAAKPMNAAAPTRPISRPLRSRERGIVIRELILQVQQEQQVEAEALDRNEDPEYKKKGKRKLKKAPVEPSRDSTPSPLRTAQREATKNKMRE